MPFRPAVALLALVATGCTNVVTAEQQGYAPPLSMNGQKQVEAQASASGAERMSTGLSDDLAPVVHPDGTLLIYQSETYEEAGGTRRMLSQVLLGVDPKKKGAGTALTDPNRLASQPSFMPDGSSFVYMSNAMGPLAMVKSETLTPNAAIKVIVSSDLAPEAAEPAVSPNGARVAFSMKGKDGGRVVAVINLDGTKQSVLGEGKTPIWNETGTELVFVRTAKDGYNHLFAAPLDVEAFKTAKQLTSGEFDCDHPSLSPDGKQLVFASNRGWKEAQKKRGEYLQLVSADADGRTLTQITNGPKRSGTPFWARDGFIYFTSDREGTLDVYRMKAPGR
jgi:Tol biopolymer transport system component